MFSNQFKCFTVVVDLANTSLSDQYNDGVHQYSKLGRG